MNKQLNKRRVIPVAIALMAVVALSGVAYAYWTVGGGGSGAGTAAGGVTGLTVVQDTVLNPMYPGDSIQIISGKFYNTNTGPVYVTTVTASISSVTKATGAPSGTCDATDFTLASAVMTVNAEVPVSATATTEVGAWTGATIKFNDKTDTIQDACKGATVHLAYSIP